MASLPEAELWDKVPSLRLLPAGVTRFRTTLSWQLGLVQKLRCATYRRQDVWTAKAGGVNNLGTIFTFDVGLTPFISLLPTSGKVAKAVGILGGGLTRNFQRQIQRHQRHIQRGVQYLHFHERSVRCNHWFGHRRYTRWHFEE